MGVDRSAPYPGGFHGSVLAEIGQDEIMELFPPGEEDVGWPPEPLRPAISSVWRVAQTLELVEVARATGFPEVDEAFAELYHRFRGRLFGIIRRVLNLGPVDPLPRPARVWVMEGLWDAIRGFKPRTRGAGAITAFEQYAAKAVRSRVVDAFRVRPWISLHEPVDPDDPDGDTLADRIPANVRVWPEDPRVWPWEGRMSPRELVRVLRNQLDPGGLEEKILDALMPPPPEDPEHRLFHTWYANKSWRQVSQEVGVEPEDLLEALERLRLRALGVLDGAVAA